VVASVIFALVLAFVLAGGRSRHRLRTASPRALLHVREPDFIGQEHENAVADLRAIGLKPTIRYVATSGEFDVVVAQSPPAGTLITRGAAVTLIVRR